MVWTRSTTAALCSPAGRGPSWAARVFPPTSFRESHAVYGADFNSYDTIIRIENVVGTALAASHITNIGDAGVRE